MKGDQKLSTKKEIGGIFFWRKNGNVKKSNFKKRFQDWRREVHHDDIQYNDTQHNNKKTTLYIVAFNVMTLSITINRRHSAL
jgi:hypothetical protein